MYNLFIIHFNHNGKEKQIVKKVDSVEEAVEFVTTCNRGSMYLKNESNESFSIKEPLEDGIYIIHEENTINVYRVENMLFEGMVWNSSYLMRKKINSYELVNGIFNEL